MATLNKNFDTLTATYLFSEIAKRTKAFLEKNPNAGIMRLGIGNTTEALPPVIVAGLKEAVEKLGKIETYTGYGDEQGDISLRNAIVEFYKNRGIAIDVTEVFVSDGSKTDAANMQQIFGQDNIVAVADPVYPVYVDSNVIAGRTGANKNGLYKKIVYMPCTEENGFVPSPPEKKTDLIYLCSPNNPTGAVATKAQLKKFVDYARAHNAIIFFDAAYSEFISDSSLPKSIYEIPGAKECAIELQSFSKFAGFTGVRLGWSIVPLNLITEEKEKGEVNRLWNRRQTTMFNGASNIAQAGGIAALSPKGQRECKKVIDYYMKNAVLIKKGMEKIGLTAYGGENAPYIWLKTPASPKTRLDPTERAASRGGSNSMPSWDFFDKLLTEAHVVGTPGAGFGPHGEGYFRLSAFGHRENIERAVESIQKNLRI